MSKIEWTNESYNPIIGCSKISEGCKNCYAEKMAYRLAHIKKTGYYEKVIAWNKPMFGQWNGLTHFVESQLEKPLKWKKPRMIFVCSMGDLFHESVPFEWIDKVMDVIKQCPQHTFQILTKRPFRMKKYFEHYYYINTKIHNIWLGVTAENQEQANKRIPILLQIPAKVRFVSIEPMLGAVDLTEIYETDEFCFNSLHTENAMDWVICGGETGHNARPAIENWVKNLKNKCGSAKIPFFFKNWGGKTKNCLIEGQEYKQFPKKH